MKATKLLASALTTGSLVVAGLVGTQALPQADPPTSVEFTASGDFSSSPAAATVMSRIGALDPDLHLTVGDLSYGATGAEQDWCDFVTSRVGAGFAFQLLAGNHEANGQNGNINDFSACLPNQLPGLVGTYGRQWYVDVPRENPLVRFVMISPGIPYPGGSWSYSAGTPRYDWTAAAIDGARAKDIPWTVVGMHKPCLSVGQYTCESGADLNTLLVQKKVDLVLSGHEHLYQRTHQLATGAGCSAIVPGTATPACIADSDPDMSRGAGTVFATVGTGGVNLRPVTVDDAEFPYFAASAGSTTNPTFGSLDVTATADTFSARFDRASGGSFTDAFTLTRGTTPTNQPPSASIAAPSCTNATCSFDGGASTDADGTVDSYEWNFGDGTMGTGRTVSHTFPASGTYTVRLTVSDDDGATGTVTRDVTVTSATNVIAADTFTRSVTGSLGTAETGGPWTTVGSGSKYSVGSGAAQLRFATAGSSIHADLKDVSRTSTDLQMQLATDKVANGGRGTFLSVTGREVPSVGSYQTKVQIAPTGAVSASLVRVNSAQASEVVLQGAVTLPGLTYAPGDKLLVRLQVTGTSPTTVRTKVWRAGTTEPTAWLRSVTDSTAGLQAAGSIGLHGYLSSGPTNVPITVTMDDVLARTP